MEKLNSGLTSIQILLVYWQSEKWASPVSNIQVQIIFSDLNNGQMSVIQALNYVIVKVHFSDPACAANIGEAGSRLEIRRQGEYQSFVT